MAIKEFKITQNVMINGALVARFTKIECEESDIAVFTAMLEGEVVVYEEKSRSGSSTTPVTSYNLLQRVTFKGDVKNTFGGIYGSGNGLVIKNNINSDEITANLAPMHLFIGHPTAKPVVSTIKPLILAGTSAV